MKIQLTGYGHINDGKERCQKILKNLKENKKISDLLQAKDKEDFKSKMIRYEKNRQLGL